MITSASVALQHAFGSDVRAVLPSFPVGLLTRRAEASSQWVGCSKLSGVAEQNPASVAARNPERLIKWFIAVLPDRGGSESAQQSRCDARAGLVSAGWSLLGFPFLVGAVAGSLCGVATLLAGAARAGAALLLFGVAALLAAVAASLAGWTAVWVAFPQLGIAAVLCGIALLYSPELPRRLLAWMANQDNLRLAADGRSAIGAMMLCIVSREGAPGSRAAMHRHPAGMSARFMSRGPHPSGLLSQPGNRCYRSVSLTRLLGPPDIGPENAGPATSLCIS